MTAITPRAILNLNFPMFSLRLPSIHRAAVVGALLVSTLSLPLAADTTISTGPYGVMSASLPEGARGLAFPLPAQNLVVARAAGNGANAISLTPDSGDIRPALAEAGACYVEVVSGELEGERFDVDLAATAGAGGSVLALQLGAGTHGTLATLPDDALVGSRLVVRPHMTLARLQAIVSPGLVGSNSPGHADGVQLFDGTEWVRYHLRADNATWVRIGETADARNLVIAPDVSVILELKSGAKAWLHHGLVRTNAFRKNLVAGAQAFASGFPQDLTPAQVGGFVDQQASADTRWTGAEDYEEADSFERRAVAGSAAAHRYFLRADGVSWTRVNDATNLANQPVLAATGAFVLRRNNADSTYAVPVPFAQ